MKKEEAKQKIFDYFNEGNLNEILNIIDTIYDLQENRQIIIPNEEEMRQEMNEHGKNVYQNTSDAQTEYSARFAYRLCYTWMQEQIIKLNK